VSRQRELHSLSSLAGRCGLTRGAILGAIGSGALPILEKNKIGARQFYELETTSIEKYLTEFRAKIVSRLAKITDPHQRRAAISSALAAVKREAQLEAGLWTPGKLAERLSCSLERANWLLNRHGIRVENGFMVSPQNWSALIAEQGRLVESKPVRSSGI
jgi:chorismate mutase